MVPVHSSGRVSRGRIERLPGGRVGALRAEDLADGDQPFDQRLCQDLWRKVPLEFTEGDQGRESGMLEGEGCVLVGRGATAPFEKAASFGIAALVAS